jgi:RHS repeat-associated protein
VDVRYDSHGSMLNLANTPEAYGLRWDYRDMIHTANLGGGGMAYYSYDAGKQRSRKRIEHNGNRVEERLYLGGMEVYRRWLNGSLVEEIETHHLFAGEQRLLIVEDVQLTDNPNLTAGVLYRYQYSNHLGSVSLELTGDVAPQVISYEEYHPYGTTAYRARNAALNATAKRYRYTGMERDEETGLSYHTARYYLPWLGRWGSCDPTKLIDGINIYSYSQNNTCALKDDSGTQSRPSSPQQRQHSPSASRVRVQLTPGIVFEDRELLNRIHASITDSNSPIPESLRSAFRVSGNRIVVGRLSESAFMQIPENERNDWLLIMEYLYAASALGNWHVVTGELNNSRLTYSIPTSVDPSRQGVGSYVTDDNGQPIFFQTPRTSDTDLLGLTVPAIPLEGLLDYNITLSAPNLLRERTETLRLSLSVMRTVTNPGMSSSSLEIGVANNQGQGLIVVSTEIDNNQRTGIDILRTFTHEVASHAGARNRGEYSDHGQAYVGSQGHPTQGYHLTRSDEIALAITRRFTVPGPPVAPSATMP